MKHNFFLILLICPLSSIGMGEPGQPIDVDNPFAPTPPLVQRDDDITRFPSYASPTPPQVAQMRRNSDPNEHTQLNPDNGISINSSTCMLCACIACLCFLHHCEGSDQEASSD